MATPICSISLFINVFLLLRSLSEGYAAKENEATKSYLHIVEVNSLLPPTACNHSSKASKSSSLEVVHRHGPCNGMLNQEKAADAPSNIEILLRDQYRVDSIHARLPSRGKFPEKQVTLPVPSGTSIGAADYVVTVGLGTPKKDFTLIFDTGSDITWTQCEPCVNNCYKQKEPRLNPSKSSSYKNISCSSAVCDLVARNKNLFFFGMPLPSAIWRRLLLDRIHCDRNLDPFINRCVQELLVWVRATKPGPVRRSSRFAGTRSDQVSLPSQTAKTYKKLFSYCLPPSSSSNGYLSFGGKVSKSVKFTPLSADFDSTPFYGLDITELSVGGRKLSIDASAFSAGTVIDSGTVISRLPPTAYSELSSEFKKLMTNYPSTSGYSIFDTCYDFSKYETVRIPKVGVTFKGGVEMDIDVSGILYPANGSKKFCLAFAGNGDDSDTSIFGNVQQRTYQVVYDGVKGRVGFAPGGCS
uniref:Peptidase A1 domain-containing protein n=1 Tax=Salix viminalis TaxID=40686 RepID=A0A6N2KCH5_SALVM